MLISKDDIIHHLMSVVPCVQFFVQRAVSQLRGVCVHVRERQARHGVCERVCVKGICHVGIVTLHTVHCIEHTANQEAVAIATAPKTRAEAPYWLQVPGVEVGEQDYFLVEALCVQSGIEQPQARLIHSKLHLENIIIISLEMEKLSEHTFKLTFIFSSGGYLSRNIYSTHKIHKVTSLYFC